MAVNLTKLRRWKSVKGQLKSKHNINVHFSDKSLGYMTAYRYICKSDKEALHTENHPDLRDIDSPRTKACMEANKAKNSATRKSGELKRWISSKGTEVSLAKVKTKSLTFTNVAEYILDSRIRLYTSLQAVALTRRQEGEKDIFSFLTKNTSKSVQKLIECVWSMHGAAEKGKFRNYFQNRKVCLNWKPRIYCHMQWEMAASCMPSTFLEQYQQICLSCCCSWEGLQETSKYLPCWTIQLWKRFYFRALGTNFQLFH